jgi:hypothetical protein
MLKVKATSSAVNASPSDVELGAVGVPGVVGAEQRGVRVAVDVGDEEESFEDGADATDVGRRVRVEVDLVVAGLPGVGDEGVGRRRPGRR